MKSIVLTGISGTVAQALRQQLAGRCEVIGLSLQRMDDLRRERSFTSWKEPLDAYRDRVTEQLAAAIAAKVPRICLASSVHACGFCRAHREDVEPIRPFPDTREDPFGVPPTSLYGFVPADNSFDPR